MTTPHERIRAALDQPAARPSTWRPDPAMEALASLPADQLTPGQRLALGYYKSARAGEAVQ